MRILTKQSATVLVTLLLAACQNLQQTSPSTSETDAAATIVSSRSNPDPVSASHAVPSATSANTPAPEAVYLDLWERIRAGFQLHEYYAHPNVARYIEDYASQQRYFDLMQERASPFLFEIVEEIERRGLPMEFALLPMVESTYNPNAYSGEHAVGLWQFVSATGESFGLQQDWWFDGRRHPIASTTAALDYMEQLYKQFDDDWLLAIAAYNTGDGNLRRAIRRSDAQAIDFWILDLPGETEAHVPKLLALSAIVAANDAWGIELEPLPNEALLRSVHVGAQIDISQAAKLAEMEYQELRALNPGYLQWATHPDGPQDMLLPFANACLLEDALSNVDRQELLTWDRYEIRPGDTLGAIARRLNTRVDILQTFNSITGSRIVAGKSLLVPRTTDPDLLAHAPRIQNSERPKPTEIPAEYKIRTGDNLWLIASRFQLRSKEIAAWNQISMNELLQPGQVLDLRYAHESQEEGALLDVNDSDSFYVVRSGDNMAAIARRLGVDLQELLAWNELKIDALIFPGQRLQVISQSLGN